MTKTPVMWSLNIVIGHITDEMVCFIQNWSIKLDIIQQMLYYVSRKYIYYQNKGCVSEEHIHSTKILHIYMFILFANGSSRKNKPAKTGSGMDPKNPDSLKHSSKKFQKVANKNVNKKALANIREFISTFTECYSSFKSGNLITSLFQGLSLLSSETDNKRLLSFYNNDSRGPKSSVFRTYVTIGDNYSKKMNQLKNGPIHEVQTREIFNSSMDSLSSSARSNLKSNHGVNQRSYSFMTNLNLNIGDIKQLTDFESLHKNKINKNYLGYLLEFWKSEFGSVYAHEESENKKLSLSNATTKKMLNKNITNLESYLAKKGKTKTKIQKESRIIKYNAALLETKLCLKIMNMLPVYSSNVRIYLLKFNSSAMDNNQATVSKLLNHIMPIELENYDEKNKHYKKQFSKFFSTEIGSDKIDKTVQTMMNEKAKFEPIPMLGRLKLSQIKQENENAYQKQLVTSLGCNITNLESFKSKCEIIRHWDRSISPGDVWRFELKETFKNGIYLNKLSELTGNVGADNSTPISHFLLIESYGDSSGAVKRKCDNEIFTNIYSPSKHQFEMKFQYSYLSLPETPDDIAVFGKANVNKEFEDPENAAFYYPDREEKFNINYDNIDLFNTKENNETEYQLRESIIEIQDSEHSSSAFEEALAYIRKLNPDTTLTKDEMDFISVENDDDSSSNNQNDEDILDILDFDA